MERVAFLLEETNDQIRCLLNPESLVIHRLAGVRSRRSIGGDLTGRGLSDDPLIFTGGGRMEIHLDLLFDVTLAGSSIATNNVRELTAPFWNLAENSTRLGYGRPPQVRFLWGKFWDIPGVVLAVSEHLEQFTADGTARRSWLRMRLLRVNETLRSDATARRLDALPVDVATLDAVQTSDRNVQLHAIVGGGMAPAQGVQPGAPVTGAAGATLAPEGASAVDALATSPEVGRTISAAAAPGALESAHDSTPGAPAEGPRLGVDLATASPSELEQVLQTGAATTQAAQLDAAAAPLAGEGGSDLPEPAASPAGEAASAPPDAAAAPSTATVALAAPVAGSEPAAPDAAAATGDLPAPVAGSEPAAPDAAAPGPLPSVEAVKGVSGAPVIEGDLPSLETDATTAAATPGDLVVATPAAPEPASPQPGVASEVTTSATGSDPVRPPPSAGDAPPTAAPPVVTPGQKPPEVAPAPAVPLAAPPAEVLAPPMIFGERLDQIAYRYYGDPRYWRLLARFNGIDDPLRVAPGRLLRVPAATAAKAP